MLGSVSRDHRKECNTIASKRGILFSIQWAFLVQHHSQQIDVQDASELIIILVAGVVQPQPTHALWQAS